MLGSSDDSHSIDAPMRPFVNSSVPTWYASDMDAWDDEGAERFIADLRWPDGVRCPKCDSRNVAARKRCPNRRWQQWRCRDCRRDFTAITGTEWAGSRRSAAELANVVGSVDQSADGNDTTAGLPPSERKMMSALRRRPLGATSAKLAELAAVSPSQTRRALRNLERRGWAERRNGTVRDGHRLASASLWALTFTADCINALQWLPQRPAPMPPPLVPDTVPQEFWRLFWSGTSGPELRISTDALHIAGSTIGSNDLSAEAWALTTLPADALKALQQVHGDETGDVASLLACELKRRETAHA